MNNFRPAQKKSSWQTIIGTAIMAVVGIFCGIWIVNFMEKSNAADLGGTLLRLACFCMVMYIAMFLHIILHEAGHLVFGFLSGYKFSSFRIGSIMWISDNGKIKLKKMSLAGTGGQCIMSPPDMVDGRIPVVLYNMGGVIMNSIIAVICLVFFLISDAPNIVSLFLCMMAITGIGTALVNGIPLRMGMVDNDGYNTLSMCKNPEAMYSFWLQIKINSLQSQGVRIKDMQEEWFKMPADENMKNSMVVVLGVLVCNRLMDAHKFSEAKALIERVLTLDTGLIDLHRNLLICDYIYCELLEEASEETIQKLYDNELQKFMKAMQNYPSVLRTQYAYELLHKKDSAKAQKIKESFQKVEKTYPYQIDIEVERELMEIVDSKIA